MSLFSIAPSPAPLLQQARRRRWIWVLCGVAVLVVLLFLSRPTYHAARRWRGRVLAREAAALLEAKKIPEAVARMQAAFQLAPGEPETLRAIARVQTSAGAASAMGYWKRLLPMREATAQDRRDAARAALLFGQPAIASDAIAQLLQEAPNSPENLELAARLAVARQDRAAALDYTNLLLARAPQHPGAEFSRAQLLFSSPEANQREAGKHLLQQMARGSAANSLPALETLAADRHLTAEETREIADQLAAHSAGKTAHRLAGLSLRIRLEPEQRAALLDEAIARFSQGDAESLLALSRWVMQLGESERVLALLPASAALASQDLLLVHLDALAALLRWGEIEKLLETAPEKVPLDAFHREVFLARAAHELGEERSADAHWARALAEAGQNPALLTYLSQYALKIDASEVAEKAIRQLARNPAWALRAYTALVPILEARGKTRSLRDVMKELLRLAPNDPIPQHDHAYLDLLLGENLANARLIADKLLRENPERIAYRSTAALSLLRAGEPAAARRLYEGVEINWAQASPGSQAVHAAVLAAVGEDDAARRAARAIPLLVLKPEERELLAAIERTLPRMRSSEEATTTRAP